MAYHAANTKMLKMKTKPRKCSGRMKKLNTNKQINNKVTRRSQTGWLLCFSLLPALPEKYVKHVSEHWQKEAKIKEISKMSNGFLIFSLLEFFIFPSSNSYIYSFIHFHNVPYCCLLPGSKRLWIYMHIRWARTVAIFRVMRIPLCNIIWNAVLLYKRLWLVFFFIFFLLLLLISFRRRCRAFDK